MPHDATELSLTQAPLRNPSILIVSLGGFGSINSSMEPCHHSISVLDDVLSGLADFGFVRNLFGQITGISIGLWCRNGVILIYVWERRRKMAFQLERGVFFL